MTLTEIQMPAGRPMQALCLCGWSSAVVASRPQAVAAGEEHTALCRVPSASTERAGEGLPVPGWAATTEANDADGLTHVLEAEVEITADGRPHTYRVHAMAEDVLVVRNGYVVVERSDDVTVTVEHLTMSVADARAIATALLSVVDAVTASTT